MRHEKTSRDFRLENIQEIIRIEQRDRIAMTRSDRLANRITQWSGSMLYVGLHVLWFGIWISVNMGFFHLPSFDPYPFSLLTMIVSLEAIFLSSFVLISQNKQAAQADKRAKIDLQVNMLAERETTKIITMLEKIEKRLHMRTKDAELRALEEKTDIATLADEIDKAEAATSGKKDLRPKSAADTSV